MLEWKQNLGVKATYRKLMDVFERAGYKLYADLVKRIAPTTTSESDTEDSSCSDGDYPFPQPPPYLVQEPYSTQSSSQVVPSQDELRYVLLNPSKAENLLKEGNNLGGLGALRSILVHSMLPLLCTQYSKKNNKKQK